MASVEPSREQFRALVREAEHDAAPITMLNLLRFRAEAEYPAGFEAEPCSGEQAYRRYAEGALGVMERVGGRPIWGAPAGQSVIAPDGESWDEVFLVYYPSRSAFLEMATDESYLEVVTHRTAALADSRLILCDAPEQPPRRFGAS